MVVVNEEDYLSHYGILRRSGRYPWGSGDTEVQRARGFKDNVKELKEQGFSEKQIADSLGLSITQLRDTNTMANASLKAADVAMATRLMDKGYSPAEGARRMGVSDSTFRDLIKPGEKDKADKLANTAEQLRQEVAMKKYVDVGGGSENYIGVSETKLRAAVSVLKDEGYVTHNVPVPQLNIPGQNTQVKVLCPPGTTWGEVKSNQSQIQQLGSWSEDNGKTFTRLQPPISIDSKRINIMYREDGGATQDGMIYVRPGVDDVSLGNSRYAQVRVLVDGTHYLKGMAVYKDDLPEGADIQFATPKSRDDAPTKLSVMKALKDEPQIEENNPFGSSLKRQIVDLPGHPNAKVTSAMNIVNEEGDWTKWSRNLASQMLSKQEPTLAKQQLAITYERRQKALDEISKLTNPTIKRKLLQTFADETDSSAVTLEAAALNRRQAYHVIIPIQSMPPGQVYAPRYKDGERVALIRYPHGGTFEIPELVVNNRQKEAKKVLGDVPDAIGIHHSVAERLSGADFDGDQVVVIPNSGSKRIGHTPALEGLKDFDPRHSYPGYEGMKVMSSRTKQNEMGKISNLITDMTIKGAPPDEIAQAVRHAMVVIDAEKHALNYRQSALDNGIPRLKEKYQRQPDGKSGAATIISRAGAEQRIPHRKPRPADQGGPINKKTGELEYVPSGATRLNRKGEKVPKEEVVDRLAITKDARQLMSSPTGQVIERIYADHSNRMKALANAARLEMINTPRLKYSPSAKVVYANEVKSLDSKLNLADRNRPRERQATILANTIYKQKLQASPELNNAEKKKLRNLSVREARHRTGADKPLIEITDKEWDAIQAGAISDSKLEKILNNADLNVVKRLATPRPIRLMTTANVARAQRLLDSGLTRAQVAERLGVSLTTLDTGLTDE